jgi:hypothetical protein
MNIAHRMRILAWFIAIGVLPIVGLGSSVYRGGAAAPAERSMLSDQHLEHVERALRDHDGRAARDAVRDAYAAAVASHQWEPLLRVGDAHRRVEEASGYPNLGKASARQNYVFALFRARDQRSLDGVLEAARAFASLGDAAATRQALMIARDVAGADPRAQARVDAAAGQFGGRLASMEGHAHE